MTRINNIRQKLQQNNCDSILISSESNRFYFAGFTGSAGYLLITLESQYIIVDFRYVEQAKIQSPDYQVVEINNIHSVYDLIKSLGLKNLAIEDAIISHCDFMLLRSNYSGAIHDGSALIDQLRIIKDENEIATIRQAVKIADDGFCHILPFIKEGVSEIDLSMELEYFMRKAGASDKSFDFIVAFAERSALPHGVATDRNLQHGDMILFDYGCIYKGYCSDISRTVFYGQPNEKQIALYDTVKKIQELTINEIKISKSGRDIDAFVRSYFKRINMLQYFGHSLGHGVGIEIHENPRLSTTSNDIMEDGMVVTVEPGLYLPNLGGVRIEDMVLVNNSGCEILTSSTKEMIII